MALSNAQSRGLASITLRVEFDPFARPSRHGRYLRVPAEDWSRRKDKARSVGGTCRHAVMASYRIAQARRGHL